MKSKLFAAISALIIAMCAFLAVACKPEERKPDPIYVDLTLEEFVEKAHTFLSPLNYLSVKGYETGLSYRYASGDSKNSINATGIVNISDPTDLSLSANIVVESTPKTSSGNSGAGRVNYAASATIVTKEYNVYLCEQTLYADRTSNNRTQKDKIENVKIDTTSLLGSVPLLEQAMRLGVIQSLGIIDADDYAQYEGFLSAANQASLVYIEYLQITYCQEKNHYRLSSVLTEADAIKKGQDPFSFSIDIYAANHVSNVIATFKNDKYNVSFDASESSANPTEPQDPESYDGTWLDELDEFYHGLDTELSDFYGSWSGVAPSTVDYYLEIFDVEGETKFRFTSSAGENTQTIEINYYELISNKLYLYSDELTYIVRLNKSDKKLAMTLPWQENFEMILADHPDEE